MDLLNYKNNYSMRQQQQKCYTVNAFKSPFKCGAFDERKFVKEMERTFSFIPPPLHFLFLLLCFQIKKLLKFHKKETMCKNYLHNDYYIKSLTPKRLSSKNMLCTCMYRGEKLTMNGGIRRTAST